MIPAPGTILYRAFVSLVGGEGRVRIEQYRVTRTTPCGVYLEDHYANKTWEGGPRLTSLNQGLTGRARPWFPWPGRFAHLTIDEALLGLRARKAAHVRHSRRRLRDAECLYEAIERLTDVPSASAHAPLFDGFDCPY